MHGYFVKTERSALLKDTLSNFVAMREPRFNPQKLLLFSCTSSVARPTTEHQYRNFYILRGKEFGYMGNVTALITQPQLEIQESTIWKFSHPPTKPVWPFRTR